VNQTYRAIMLEGQADNFRAASAIRTLTTRPLEAGEVLVRNHYCGINGIFDTHIAKEKVDYVTIHYPSFTGVEALGVVEEVGEGVTDLAVGDAVVTTRFPGGYREINIAPVGHFVKVPAAHPDWLALYSTGVAAMVALDVTGQLQAGETVAISAAAGGLGQFMVQIALRRGCHVVAIAGGPEKADYLRSMGAHRVVDYRAEDLAQVLAAEYPEKLDVAVDTVSGPTHDALLANLARGGRLVIGGVASDRVEGGPPKVLSPRIGHSIYLKGASVRGFMNGLLTQHWPEARAKLAAMYQAGELTVRLDQPVGVGLESVYDAVERMLAGASMGKIIVDVRSA
jgi:NADPH-dependent curcumin reductase CurA